ncbi:daptide biosynthesis RiPP recognition protein [Nocardioides sp. LML1-1-1.1]|uniref:daptide biosynthesis RiPP recognition protein n=1 Tax=Nocardioides sp. LML1-1-1.1 TaxID=3135248 RepID=UPI00343E37D6
MTAQLEAPATGATREVKGSRRTLKTWGSGLVSADVFESGLAPFGDTAAVVVLDRAEHWPRLLDSGVVGADSRVFVPRAEDSGPSPLVMGYEGSLSDPGGEVQVGASFFLQTQDYGTSEYLSLIGATLVRVVDEADLETFLDDADRARTTGVFPEFLTHHLVALCDVPALGGRYAEDGPSLRLFVDVNGAISTSPSGLRLGEVGDDFATLEKEWLRLNGAGELPCSVCLGAAISDEVRVPAITARPWLSRYHDAIAGIRHLRGREIGFDHEIQVSGFGARMTPELADVDAPADDRSGAPTLLWTADAAFVHSPLTDRVFRLEREAGAVVERLMVHGSVDAAAGPVPEETLLQVRDFFARAGLPLCD